MGKKYFFPKWSPPECPERLEPLSSQTSSIFFFHFFIKLPVTDFIFDNNSVLSCWLNFPFGVWFLLKGSSVVPLEVYGKLQLHGMF